MDTSSLKLFLAPCRENSAERLRDWRSCSSCEHGPHLNEEPDDYLSKLDKCTEAICEVVLEK